MTDPAIKAALEAAGWGVCEARAKVNECDGRCPRAAPCVWCAASAAAAIAAFLRAAPIHSIGRHMLGGYRESHGPHAREELAAAVEEAARDG